jgi:hypothetical protein
MYGGCYVWHSIHNLKCPGGYVSLSLFPFMIEIQLDRIFTAIMLLAIAWATEVQALWLVIPGSNVDDSLFWSNDIFPVA